MAEIYVACVTPLYDNQIFEKKCKWLSAERREGLDKYRKQEDKCRSMGAGLLLEYGLREYGFSLSGVPGKRAAVIRRGEHGKPYIEGVSLHFNLSHSGEYAVAAFGTTALGVDIERIRSVNEKLAERFFTKEEAAFLEETVPTERDRVFTALWTRKESYMKAVGKGMSLPLRDFSVIGDKIPFATWKKPEGYCLSVCGQDAAQAVVYEVDLQKIFEEEGAVSCTMN